MNRKTFFILALLYGVCFGSIARADKSTSDSTDLADFMDQENDSAPSQLQQKQEDKTATTEKQEPKAEGFGDKIVNVLKGTTKKVFPSDTTEVVPVKRSNASVFDIAGVMLHMNRQQAEDAISKHGYRRISADLRIPNFIRWRYEEMCRNKNVTGYERINSCVVKLAQKNNYQYVERLTFNNFQTKEIVRVKFTSNFTGNKAYVIEYKSIAADVKGSGAKAKYLRNIKILEFWKKISQKYGAPDNKEQVTWGLGFNKPSLHAETGYLILQDPILLNLDHARMAREDQKFIHSAVYTF